MIDAYGIHLLCEGRLGSLEQERKTVTMVDFEMLLTMLASITEKVEEVNANQHAGLAVLPEDWAELKQLTHEAKGVLDAAGWR